MICILFTPVWVSEVLTVTMFVLALSPKQKQSVLGFLWIINCKIWNNSNSISKKQLYNKWRPIRITMLLSNAEIQWEYWQQRNATKNNKCVRLGCHWSDNDSGGGHHQLDDVRHLLIWWSTAMVRMLTPKILILYRVLKKHRAIELNWACSAKPRPFRDI